MFSRRGFFVGALALGFAALLIWPGDAHALGREKPDFTQYETPLYEQVVGRIRAIIAAKLGDSPNTRDRYFVVPFAYENRGNEAAYSHSFITVIRVFAAGKKPSPNSEFKTGSYKGWSFEAYTISWIPHDFLENPNLCVFQGPGARLFPEKNTCPVSVGKCFNLEETLKIAAAAKVAVGMWGPYEIQKGGFDLGVRRKELLDSGVIKYRADDRLYRDKHIAINCFHAMASIDEPFPNGGAFGSGFKMWGLNGTARVLLEYTTRANRRGLLLDPVDIKKDLFGFAYAPGRSHRRVYSPFKQAAAYHR